jgi:hypothetical protein
MAENYLYSSAADYAGKIVIPDDVMVVNERHAIQSRGSGVPAFKIAGTSDAVASNLTGFQNLSGLKR